MLKQLKLWVCISVNANKLLAFIVFKASLLGGFFLYYFLDYIAKTIYILVSIFKYYI